MNVIDNSIKVVREQKSVGTDAKNAAGAAIHLAIDQKASDEILRLVIVRIEADHSIACANCRMACSMERDKK